MYTLFSTQLWNASFLASFRSSLEEEIIFFLSPKLCLFGLSPHTHELCSYLVCYLILKVQPKRLNHIHQMLVFTYCFVLLMTFRYLHSDFLSLASLVYFGSSIFLESGRGVYFYCCLRFLNLHPFHSIQKLVHLKIPQAFSVKYWVQFCNP